MNSLTLTTRKKSDMDIHYVSTSWHGEIHDGLWICDWTVWKRRKEDEFSASRVQCELEAQALISPPSPFITPGIRQLHNSTRLNHSTFQQQASCRYVWNLIMSFVVLKNVILVFSSLVGPRYHIKLYGQRDISNQDSLLSHSCMRQARSCSNTSSRDWSSHYPHSC